MELGIPQSLDLILYSSYYSTSLSLSSIHYHCLYNSLGKKVDTFICGWQLSLLYVDDFLQVVVVYFLFW